MIIYTYCLTNSDDGDLSLVASIGLRAPNSAITELENSQ